MVLNLLWSTGGAISHVVFRWVGGGRGGVDWQKSCLCVGGCDERVNNNNNNNVKHYGKVIIFFGDDEKISSPKKKNNNNSDNNVDS